MTRRTLAACLALSIVALSAAVGTQAPPPAQAPAAVTPRAPAPLDAATLQAKVDELVEGHMKTRGFMGAVLLAKDGKPLVSKGYGFANVEWKVPNTPNTKFRIGSVTKQFTSMLVMQLRERGRIKLEDSMCVYIAPCPDTWKPVTIHHLLTHTSGIPSYTGIPAWRQVNMVPKTTEQIIALFRDLPLQWTPGERYAYNNSGYFLLGVIIEKITGVKYEQALQEMILTPLGLSDTGYDWTTTIIPRRAMGYTGLGSSLANTAPIAMQHPYAAGAMYSTVEDLLKWDQALYTTTLLPDSARKIMWTPFLNGYAYGWSIAPPSTTMYGGHASMLHGGGINGFSAMIVRVPGAKLTIVVLGNNDSANAGPVARDIGAIYFGQGYEVPGRSNGKIN